MHCNEIAFLGWDILPSLGKNPLLSSFPWQSQTFHFLPLWISRRTSGPPRACLLGLCQAVLSFYQSVRPIVLTSLQSPLLNLFPITPEKKQIWWRKSDIFYLKEKRLLNASKIRASLMLNELLHLYLLRQTFSNCRLDLLKDLVYSPNLYFSLLYG